MRRRFGVWCRVATTVGVVLSVRAAGVEVALPARSRALAPAEAGFPAPPGQIRPAPAGRAILCRVLESHTSDRDQMTVVVFHQRDAGDRARLGELIRQRDGAAVTFKMTDPNPHSATLFRLKSCFGRGLLLFPAASARLSAGDEFELQIEAKAIRL